MPGGFSLDLDIITVLGAYTRWRCFLREVQTATLSPGLKEQLSA